MRISDWSSDVCSSDLGAPTLQLTENPDILTMLATSPHRPRLLIGFAAETDHVIDHATAKRAKKDADWIVANDVSGDVMGARPTPSTSSARKALKVGKNRSEEHTSELQQLMRTSYAVFCLK